MKAPGRVSGAFEPKGSEPLTITALSRAARYQPEPVSKARPSPEETLRLVLACLDDMKAEDTISIDLRGKIRPRHRPAVARTVEVSENRARDSHHSECAAIVCLHWRGQAMIRMSGEICRVRS